MLNPDSQWLKLCQIKKGRWKTQQNTLQSHPRWAIFIKINNKCILQKVCRRITQFVTFYEKERATDRLILYLPESCHLTSLYGTSEAISWPSPSVGSFRSGKPLLAVAERLPVLPSTGNTVLHGEPFFNSVNWNGHLQVIDEKKLHVRWLNN